MPWCEPCAKYLTPSAMNEDGTCPSCGTAPSATTTEAPPVTLRNRDIRRLAAGEGGDPDDLRAPWHFKVLVTLLVLYLGWRIVDLFV